VVVEDGFVFLFLVDLVLLFLFSGVHLGLGVGLVFVRGVSVLAVFFLNQLV